MISISLMRFPKCDEMDPDKKLYERSIYSKEGRYPMEEGRVPWMELLLREMNLSDVKLPNVLGSVPESIFDPKRNSFTAER